MLSCRFAALICWSDFAISDANVTAASLKMSVTFSLIASDTASFIADFISADKLLVLAAPDDTVGCVTSWEVDAADLLQALDGGGNS